MLQDLIGREATHEHILHVLDLGDRLQHLCFTTKTLLNVDAAQLNALTATQQHFIAEWPPGAHRPPISVDNAGCREVVRGRQTLAVVDTREHPVLCGMPWTSEWRGYMGAPIWFEGQIIGSVCALTATPRHWLERDRLALEGIATLVSCSLDPEI